MDIFLSVIIFILPLIILCILSKILKLDNNTANFVMIVVFALSLLISLIISIYWVFSSIGSGPFELLKRMTFLFLFIIFWLSGTNDFFNKLIKKILDIKMHFFLFFKIFISLTLLKLLIKLVYCKFVLNISQYNSYEEYIGYFLIYTWAIIFMNMFIKGLKYFKKITKIVNYFDCIDFLYILSLNILLLVLSDNNEVILPVSIFSLTVSIYSVKERIINYYFEYENTIN